MLFRFQEEEFMAIIGWLLLC